MTVKIRKACLEDIPAIVRVSNQSFLEMARRPSIFGLGVLRRIVENPGYQFVAVHNGKVIGFLIGELRNRVAHISWIAVHPSYQGRGVGSRLMKTFESEVSGKADKVVTGTPFARGFYEKLGFRCIKVVYRLIKELICRRVESPTVLLRTIDIENLERVMCILNDEAVDFLRSFFEAYEKDPDKIFEALEGNRFIGVAVARENRWTSELIEVTYLHVVNEEAYLKVLETLEAKFSMRGVRWLGVTVENSKYVAKLKREGWVESRLPMFWTHYVMEKILR